MTFTEMRFPIVWITLALCVMLCGFEVHAGPVSAWQRELALDQKDQEPALIDSLRSPRQELYPFDDDSEEDDDGFGGAAYPSGEDDDDDDDEERSLRRSIREASQKPAVVEEETETDEDSVIPSGVTPAEPEKKPSVLELLSTALDKAIEATSKIPTQQVATDAAGVFQILGQVFSEAIDKVIGSDDGPDDEASPAVENPDNKIPEEPSEPSALPAAGAEQPAKPEPQQETNQSDKETVNNL